LALSVPLSRFTSRVGGGSAFFVRHHLRTMKRGEFKTIRTKGIKAMCYCLLSYLFIWGTLFIIIATPHLSMVDKHALKFMVIVVSASVLTFVLPIVWISKKVLGSYGLLCQKCRCELTADPTVPTTGECPKCHAKIFDDA
jgi:hypothetical protein